MEQNNKVKVYTSSLGGNLEISVSGMKQTVEATNNRARYYAEQSLKYRDEAKMYAENAQYYADQNADVSKEDGRTTDIRYAACDAAGTQYLFFFVHIGSL